jgi:isopenicillin N synthase-like dioxygenase
MGDFQASPPGRTGLSQEAQQRPCGDCEEGGTWVYVPPVEDTLAVFPGDMMSYLTSGSVPAKLHKVSLCSAERYSLAYFVEPSFNKCQ